MGWIRLESFKGMSGIDMATDGNRSSPSSYFAALLDIVFMATGCLTSATDGRVEEYKKPVLGSHWLDTTKCPSHALQGVCHLGTLSTVLV